MALAACTRVDSCFAPWFVPSLGVSLQLAQLDIHLCHHLEQLGTGKHIIHRHKLSGFSITQSRLAALKKKTSSLVFWLIVVAANRKPIVSIITLHLSTAVNVHWVVHPESIGILYNDLFFYLIISVQWWLYLLNCVWPLTLLLFLELCILFLFDLTWLRPRWQDCYSFFRFYSKKVEWYQKFS